MEETWKVVVFLCF